VKVAFDQQAFVLQPWGGITRYLSSLVRYYLQEPQVQTAVYAPLHFNGNLAALPPVRGRGVKLPKVNTKLFSVVMESSRVIARLGLSHYAPDVLHETYYSRDDFRPGKARRVLTVYDLIHERYGDMFVNSQGTTGPKRIAALRADHVICISESTRRDLIEYYGVAPEKTSVVYLSADVEFVSASDSGANTGASGQPYVLYVGNRDGYKNFNAFLEAFASSPLLLANFRVLCFGGSALSPQELALADSLGLSNGQLAREGGGDEVLARLYRGAAALVYPSLYEGFGMPPLEAMAAGCPVICSNTSALPEVVGNAGEYFDPASRDNMAAAMERVLDSASRRQELLQLGRQQLKLFSWERCARETLDIYRSLL